MLFLKMRRSSFEGLLGGFGSLVESSWELFGRMVDASSAFLGTSQDIMHFLHAGFRLLLDFGGFREGFGRGFGRFFC